MSNVKLLPTPTKSPNDKKDYRLIQLENGLLALLISEAGTSEHAEEVESDGDEQSDFSDDSSRDDSGSVESGMHKTLFLHNLSL